MEMGQEQGPYRKGGRYRHWHDDAHHRPHWDEENKDGSGHENIYPLVPVVNPVRPTVPWWQKPWPIIKALPNAAGRCLRVIPVLPIFDPPGDPGLA